MPNFLGVVNAVYLQADSSTKQAIVAVGGVSAIVSALMSLWPAFLSMTSVSSKVSLLVQRLKQGRNLTNSVQSKLSSAADQIIRNL